MSHEGTNDDNAEDDVVFLYSKEPIKGRVQNEEYEREEEFTLKLKSIDCSDELLSSDVELHLRNACEGGSGAGVKERAPKLKRKRRRTHYGTSVLCKICGNKFESQSSLSRQQLKKNIGLCRQCGRTYCRSDGLERQKRSIKSTKQTNGLL